MVCIIPDILLKFNKQFWKILSFIEICFVQTQNLNLVHDKTRKSSWSDDTFD
jgi:hypothetical protein